MQGINKIIFLYILITFLILTPLAQSNPTTTATASVTDFGAVGNGNADDTYAVQSAINSSFSQVKFPAGRTYRIKTLHVPAGVELVVEEGAVIFGSKELKGRNAACWGVSLAARGGGVVVCGGERIDGTWLISVKKGGHNDVNLRWGVFKMRIRPNNFCIVCDHGFSCDPISPGHW